MEASDYIIGDKLNVGIEWFDINGKYHILNIADIDEADDIIGLLSGRICVEDLKP